MVQFMLESCLRKLERVKENIINVPPLREQHHIADGPNTGQKKGGSSRVKNHLEKGGIKHKNGPSVFYITTL